MHRIGCRFFLLLFVLNLLPGGSDATASAAERFTGPWNLDELKQVPHATWGEKDGLVQEVYFQGEPLDGKLTSVFG